MTQETEIQQYQEEGMELATTAKNLPIKNDKQAVDASAFVKDLKGRISKVKEFFKPIVETAHQAHKTACDRRNLVLKPLEGASKLLGDRVATYKYEQQQKREAEARKAQEVADAKEKAKQDKILAQAQEAEEKGDTEKAEALVEKAEEVYVAPKPTRTVVQTATAVRIVYDVCVTDKTKVPSNYLIVDEAKLKRLIAADNDIRVPGITFVKRAIGVTRQ